jgi:hypothetical protein
MLGRGGWGLGFGGWQMVLHLGSNTPGGKGGGGSQRTTTDCCTEHLALIQPDVT